MNHFGGRIQRFCIKAVWFVVLCIVSVFAVAGLFQHSKLRSPEIILHTSISPLFQLGTSLLMILFLAELSCIFHKKKGFRTGIMFVWTVAAALFAYHVDVRQMLDFEAVCSAAQRFAAGSYQALEKDYFHACSYQLGTCLMLEVVCRLLPGIPLELFMRVSNVLMCSATVVILANMSNVVFGENKASDAAFSMYLLCFAVPLYCVHVYGTIPMVFLCTCAFFCFVQYIRRRAVILGVGWALLVAVSYMVKPNTAIVLLALIICVMVDMLVSRDRRMILFALLAVVLSMVLSQGAVIQYEFRSGIKMRENISMLSRLTMGLQEGPMAAGWYNEYIGQFYPAEVTPEMEKEIVEDDLKMRISEFVENPHMAVSFFGRKATSQWLKPTYGSMNYGYNQRIYWKDYEQAPWVRVLYEQDGKLRLALEGFMKVWQQTVYMLTVIGLWYGWRKADQTVQLILPLVVLGGFLYHMIFEAKSQYIYVYMLYLVPIAAQGLCEAEYQLRKLMQRSKSR